MRAIFAVVSILCLSESTLGQEQTQFTKCPFLNNNGINIFISGYRDTIQPNGLRARIIKSSSLVNGFELVSNDSLVIIRGYHLVFDNSNGTLYSKTTRNSRMMDVERQIVPLQKIKDAILITIDQITIEYRGTCYKIESQLYYAE